TIEERVERIKNVSKEDYRRAYERFIAGNWSVFGIGPESGKIIEKHEMIV
ncbi:MAG TPA: insulinase family protein, partial [Thermotoga sp.]|nr:insulinase family protein [Thermotoga sp.]